MVPKDWMAKSLWQVFLRNEYVYIWIYIHISKMWPWLGRLMTGMEDAYHKNCEKGQAWK